MEQRRIKGYIQRKAHACLEKKTATTAVLNINCANLSFAKTVPYFCMF